MPLVTQMYDCELFCGSICELFLCICFWISHSDITQHIANSDRNTLISVLTKRVQDRDLTLKIGPSWSRSPSASFSSCHENSWILWMYFIILSNIHVKHTHSSIFTYLLCLWVLRCGFWHPRPVPRSKFTIPDSFVMSIWSQQQPKTLFCWFCYLCRL